MRKILLILPFILMTLGAKAQVSYSTDINPGADSSDPCALQVLNNKLYFNADDGVHGRELWCYEPYVGTYLVHDIVSGPFGSTLSNRSSNDYASCSAGGKLYFGAAGFRIYNGVDTPVLLSDTLGTQYITELNGKLYFASYSYNTGTELYRYDPANGQVQMIADINPGMSSSSPRHLIAFNNKLYFSATKQTTQRELFVYNPTSNVASLAADIDPLGEGDPQMLTVINNKLYFEASEPTYGLELYSYSGTGAPTRLTDIQPGTDPGLLYYGPAGTPVFFQNKIYFCGNSPSNGRELYSYNPANNQVQLAFDLAPGAGHSDPQNFTYYGNKLYFSATSATEGKELWSYDGINPPSVVMDLNPGTAGSNPTLLKLMGNKLYFNATNGSTGLELYEFYDVATSVKGLNANMEISVYPVPASDEVIIGIDALNDISFAAELYDINGKLVHSVAMQHYACGKHDIRISLSSFACGSYQYKLTGKNGAMLAMGKIVKQ